MSRQEERVRAILRLRRMRIIMIVGYGIIVALTVVGITLFSTWQNEQILSKKINDMTVSLNAQMEMNFDSYLERMEKVGTLAFAMDEAYTYDATDDSNDENEAINTEKAITDELTKDVTFNEDGSIDLKLAAADYCGFASPVAPIKVKDGKTTADQYYLAVPAKDKLSTLEEVKKDLEAAAPVEEKIEAIGEVTLESEEKISTGKVRFCLDFFTTTLENSVTYCFCRAILAALASSE